MFLKEKREIVKTIQGFEIKFRYPTITDEIQIESKKNVITRGQYSSMSIGILNSQIEILNLIQALSTLSVVASFSGKDQKDYYWEGFGDDDGREFILEVYKEFQDWRQSFRSKPKTVDEG